MLSRYALAIAVAVITSTHASDVAGLIQIKEHNLESINKTVGGVHTKLWPIIFAPKAGFVALKLTTAWFKGAGAIAGKAATAKGTATTVATKALDAGAYAAVSSVYGAACGALVGSIIGTVFKAAEATVSAKQAYVTMLEQHNLNVNEDYNPNSASQAERAAAYFKSKIWDATMGEATARRAADFAVDAFTDELSEAIGTPSEADTVQSAVTMMGDLTIESLSGITSGVKGKELDELIEVRDVNFGYGILVARLTANTMDCAYFNNFDHESCKAEAYDILKDFIKDRGGEIACDAAGKMIGLG